MFDYTERKVATGMCILVAGRDPAYSGSTDYASLGTFTVCRLKPFINISLSTDCLLRAFFTENRMVREFGLSH